MFVITMATDRNSLSGFQQGLVLIGRHQNPPSLCGEMTACTVKYTAQFKFGERNLDQYKGCLFYING